MNLFFATGEQNDKHKTNYAKRISEYKNKQKDFKGENLKFLELVNRDLLESEDCFEKIEHIVNKLFKNGLKPNEIVIAFNNDNCIKTFSKEEFVNLKKLDKFYEEKNIKIGVFDYKDIFNYDQVWHANEIIKKNAKVINKLDLSPLEKILYAYLIVTQKTYNLETEEQSLAQSRSVYGVLNSDKICCVGFSEYLKSLVNELNDKNINIFGNSVGIIENKIKYLQYGIHRNNIVYLSDDKYKLNGFYYLDPTWDYGKREYLTYFLINLSEIKNIYGCKICDSEKAFKNVTKVEKDIFKLNATKNYCNIIPVFASSVASNSFRINDSLNFGKKTEPNIYSFLQNNQKFKECLVYKQTESDLKANKYVDEEKILINNYNLVQKDIKNLSVTNDKNFMWKLLNENSPKVDLVTIQNALYTLYKKVQKNCDKDKISKYVFDIIKMNINDSNKLFKSNSQLAFAECEKIL